MESTPRASMLNASFYRDGYQNSCSRLCDICKAASCIFYCHSHSAFLCTVCDQSLHGASNMTSQHERVWICTSCENAPAEFTCEADAAFLCTNCDNEVHSANMLARRHIRVPITPFCGLTDGSSVAQQDLSFGSLLDKSNEFKGHESYDLMEAFNEDEADSWLLLEPENTSSQTNDGLFHSGEEKDHLDPADYNSCTTYQPQEQQQINSIPQGINCSDGVVPVQPVDMKQPLQNIYWDRLYESTRDPVVNAASSSQSVPNPFFNASTSPIPTMNDTSNSFPRPPMEPTNLFMTAPIFMPFPIPTINREAKVLRYREKRKARKFEKKIRYASRKTYAENRPRSKGRFARKTDIELDVDQMFSLEDYGIVPSY